MTDTPPSAPPGWYPDPWGQAEQRYFDGAQWTGAVHGTPAAAPAPAPVEAHAGEPAAQTDGAPAGRKRRRTGLIVGLSLGGVAVVAVVAVVLALVVIPRATAPTLYTDRSPQYDYTDDVLDVGADHTFTFPAAYDIEELNRSHASGAAADAVDAPPYAFQVYLDRGLTSLAEFTTIQFGGGDDVRVSGFESDTAEGSLSESEFQEDVRIKAGEEDDLLGWGLHPEYFLVQRVDREGNDLAKPIVTRFTVAGALAPPEVVFDTPAGEGSLQLSWDAVDGATDYIVVTSQLDPATGRRSYDFAGRTSETTWSSAAGLDPSAPAQNVDLQAFIGPSADEISEGAEAYEQRPFDIGVIATDGTVFSPYISHDLVSIAGSLPLENAFYATMALKRTGPSGFIESIDDLPRRFPFTSVDGTTRSTVAYLDEKAFDQGDYWLISLRGRGTALEVDWGISKTAVPDIAAAVARFNAEAQAAAPDTGMPQFEIVSAPVDEAVGPTSERADVPYPVYGSTEFTRFIASHLIAGTRTIDITAWVNEPGAPSPYDAFYEAVFQNPYALDVSGVNVDDGLMSIAYSGVGMNEQKQGELKAKVDSVLAETITDGMSDADKVTALNDWIAANAVYDDAALDALIANGWKLPSGYDSAWDPTGVLIEGIGVCASYADAFNALANAAGVATVVVTGDVVDGGPHAWNKVLVDGTWLAVDATWNDSPQANQFLMIPDSGFSGTATRSEDDDWVIDGSVGQYATP